MSILARQGQVESVHDFDDADTRVALASRFKAELKVALASEEEYRRRGKDTIRSYKHERQSFMTSSRGYNILYSNVSTLSLRFTLDHLSLKSLAGIRTEIQLRE